MLHTPRGIDPTFRKQLGNGRSGHSKLASDLTHVAYFQVALHELVFLRIAQLPRSPGWRSKPHFRSL
jgi:hypothetical protein